MNLRVRFKNGLFANEELFLIAEVGVPDGPICTWEQYENFETPYAHLFPNGQILQFGFPIGHRDDLFIWNPLQLQ